MEHARWSQIATIASAIAASRTPSPTWLYLSVRSAPFSWHIFGNNTVGVFMITNAPLFDAQRFAQRPGFWPVVEWRGSEAGQFCLDSTKHLAARQFEPCAGVSVEAGRSWKAESSLCAAKVSGFIRLARWLIGQA
jgi:hypothetical protein